ncbi:MAG: 3-oxoadipate enol-lactonase [Pseudonocardiales bacterium]|nr:3-oxoadipate enol-lactonase [Pseudonocardiales bacterium]
MCGVSEPVELHHRVDGPPDAPVVVLAGPLGTTLDVWAPQAAALANRFRVLRIDLRGHGDSPVPEPPYRMADLAGDALAVLDALDIERAAWCGLSLGGMVCLCVASEQPQRVSRLVLSSTTAGFPDAAPWRDRIAAVAAGGTAAVADSVVSRWFTPGYAAAHPAEVDTVREMVVGTDDSGYLGCCQAVEVWDHRARLGAVTAPTLVIGGAHDASTPVQLHTAPLAEHIPGARLEVLDAAHLANVEQEQEFNRLVAEHLS